MSETIKYTNENITLIPIKTGLGVYLKDKKILDLGLKDAQSLMICFMDFARDMMPPTLPPTKGVRKPKTSKHK